MQQNKTVVYKFRTVDNTGYYVQFKPTASAVVSAVASTPSDIPQIEIELFPEDTKSSDIPSLLNQETYYVVDAGKTKDNCSPGPFVVCRVIIVASPDEQHWGGSGFMKDDQTGLGGEIRYFPAWSLPQLEAASTLLSKVQFQVGDVQELYTIFGGIPRHVFAPKRKERNRTQLKSEWGCLSTT